MTLRSFEFVTWGAVRSHWQIKSNEYVLALRVISDIDRKSSYWQFWKWLEVWLDSSLLCAWTIFVKSITLCSSFHYIWAYIYKKWVFHSWKLPLMRYMYNDARGNVVISNKTVRENAQTTGISHHLKKLNISRVHSLKINTWQISLMIIRHRIISNMESIDSQQHTQTSSPSQSQIVQRASILYHI